MQPFEVVAAPYVCYSAPTGTPFPDLATDPPPSPWAVLGTSGSRNYTDAGVAVALPQTINTFTPAGSTAVRKAWRVDEGIQISVSLADMTLEQFSTVMGGLAISAAAGAAGPPVVTGNKSVEILRGPLVNAVAFLVRGISPYDETKLAQFEIPGAYQAGNPSPTFSKANPAELSTDWHAYELNVGHLGTFRAATAS